MFKSISRIVILNLLFLVPFILFAKTPVELWTPLDNSKVKLKGTRIIEANNYLSYRLDLPALQNLLFPLTAASRNTELIISLPFPDGTFKEFVVTPSVVMDPALAARYPGIRTFNAEGITDPSSIAKLDITQFGFHAMILSSNGTIYIDPFTLQDQDHYMVYHKRDFVTSKNFVCHSVEENMQIDHNRLTNIQTSVAKSVGTELKTYRLALAATGEYTAFFGGTVPNALAAIVTSVNRVTGVYEREFSIRLILIPNNDLLIYTNPSTDPYTNSNGGTMLGQNQTNITSVIGSANFDIGHVYSTGGGGIAGLGVVCSLGLKARGVTGSSSPVGDPFDIDYVAHEMGHQFGGNHTFNCEVGACNGNRSYTTAYEPGSGSTIMAYAGICGSNNLQSNSDDCFHVKSFDEIITYTTTGVGSWCPVITPTNNNPPVIIAGTNYIIPYLTPFRLTANAFDPDGDPLTYCWEQFNLGPAGTWNNPIGNAPIFRSFDPTADPVRLFPKRNNILNNNQTIGEVKPSYARTLSFKLTVRDNRINGGGVTSTDTALQVEVINTGQAFAVTSPDTSGIIWPAGGIATVTWDVGGSDVPPVNTPDVNILLSTDGGQTFPVILAQSVPNTGSYNVNVPPFFTLTARVMVEGDGNIFFDINNKNFEIGFVGLGENIQQSGVYIGPNPVKESFQIIINNEFIAGRDDNRIEFIDVTGRNVNLVRVTENRQWVDVKNWSKGIYLYRFMNDDGMVRTGKIVVQ